MHSVIYSNNTSPWNEIITSLLRRERSWSEFLAKVSVNNDMNMATRVEYSVKATWQYAPNKPAISDYFNIFFHRDLFIQLTLFCQYLACMLIYRVCILPVSNKASVCDRFITKLPKLTVLGSLGVDRVAAVVEILAAVKEQ